MRIACSSTSLIPSETANSIQVVMACNGLTQAGQTVKLWIPGEGSVDFSAIQSQYGIPDKPFEIVRLKSVPALRRLDFSFQAVSEAERWQADGLYTWTIQAAVMAALRGKRTAFEVHDLPTGSFGRRWFALYVKSPAPKKFLFITSALRDAVRAQYPGIAESDCLITPNGINASDYEALPSIADAKKKLGVAADKTVVSCSGHLYAGRGADLFLSLAARFPNILFYWFGGNPDSVHLNQEKANNAGLKNVVFTGFIPRAELPMKQAASDILIMPYASQIAGSGGGNSAAICSPMKLFEYLGVGRAILSSDLPVIHEVLDEDSAVFCEPENLTSWTDGLNALISQPELQARKAAAAKAKASRYTWKGRAESILKML